MKNVTWPDNVCSYNDTCIHGSFSPDDMVRLFDLIPDGHFTPTFGNSLGSKRITPELIRSVYGEVEKGYYFTVPIKSPQFKNLMVQLRLETPYPLRRGQGCFPCHTYWREPMNKPLLKEIFK